MRRAALTLALLFTICASLAEYLKPRAPLPAGRDAQSAGVIERLMGDSRRLFATHFLLKADAYFHSGFYPGVFDNPTRFEESHIAEESFSLETGEASEENHRSGAGGDEKDHGFLGAPRDWIDQFSRHFYPSIHTHLDEGGAKASEHQGA